MRGDGVKMREERSDDASDGNMRGGIRVEKSYCADSAQ